MNNSYSEISVKTNKKSRKNKNNDIKNDENVVEQNEENLIFPDSNWDGLSNGVVNVNDVIREVSDVNNLTPDSYKLEPIVVLKKKTYTEAHRRAQQKYREKFPDKYCEQQRKLYEEKKKDEEWKKKFNERSRLNNEKYRIRKRQELLEQGAVFNPRGRPRKEKNDTFANGVICEKCRKINDGGSKPNLCKQCSNE